MDRKNTNNALLIGLPVLAPLVFMLVGTIVALQNAPSAAPVVAPELPRDYAQFMLPVTVSLPQGQGTVSLAIGVAYERGNAADLYGVLTERADLLPMIVTRAVQSAAETLQPSDLHAALPAVLRDAFNTELASQGQEPAVLEVFLTDWAATW